MSHLRAVVRLIGVAAVSFVSTSLLILSGPVIDAFGRLRGREDAAGGWRTTIFRTWCRATCAVIGIRVEIDGTPPPPPYILVSNHLSYLDVILLGSQLRGCVFVAKAEVERWPAVGSMCRSVNTLFIDRGNKRDIPRVMAHMDKILKRGRGVVLFPEGTTSGGDAVQPFRGSLLEIAARSGQPVSHASLSYHTPEGSPPARESVCWWGDADFGPHIYGLLRLPGIRAKLAFGDEAVQESDRKALAARLQAGVESRFQPSV